MKTYQCHKRVEAAQITSVGSIFHAEDGDHVKITVDDGVEFELHASVISRYMPVPGDYLVRYLPDGYLSISPKAAFESGYAEIV